MTCTIVYEGEHIADVDEHGMDIIVPPGETVLSPIMHARVDLKSTNTVLDLLDAGGGPLDLNCVLYSNVEEFQASLNYRQDATPAIVHLGE